jgi:hypothetical protein
MPRLDVGRVEHDHAVPAVADRAGGFATSPSPSAAPGRCRGAEGRIVAVPSMRLIAALGAPGAD